MGGASCEHAEYMEWPKEFNEVKIFENSLLCQICGDFYVGPVILPCSHSFCSECVRKFMLSQGLKSCCPECRKPCNQNDLMANRSLGNVVELYRSVRAQFQKLAGLNPPEMVKMSTQEHILEEYNNPASTTSTSKFPMPFYKQLKDREVRDLLVQRGLPTGKSRDHMVHIHKQVQYCRYHENAILND